MQCLWIKRWKIFILCLGGILILLGAIIMALRSGPDDDKSRYARLLQARRLEARFIQWRNTTAYRVVARVTKSDPVEHFRKQSDQLEEILFNSGALVELQLYSPHRLLPLPQSVGRAFYTFVDGTPIQSFVSAESPRAPAAQWVRWSRMDAMHTTLVCRPQDAAFWRTANCWITNRLDLASLKNFAGDPDKFSCLLPDGRFVDFGAGLTWLNQSIADGWMVGAEFQPEQWSDSRLLLYRRKPGSKVD